MPIHRSCVAAVLAALAFGLLTSAGCSHRGPYPKTWPPLRPVRGQSCERVAGTYSNRGERGYTVPGGWSDLMELLVGAQGGGPSDTVTLSFPLPDTFEITTTSEWGPRVQSLSRKAGQFSCDGSTLVVKRKSMKNGVAVAPPGVFIAGGESAGARVDLIERCLIVTQWEKEYLVLPIPGWERWTSWYRFCPVLAAPSGNRAR